MATGLIRHGTNAGYKAEITSGQNVCERCRNARRVFNSQYSKTAKAKGIKYGSHDVIDHLYHGRTGPARNRTRTVTDRPGDGVTDGSRRPSEDTEAPPGPSAPGPDRTGLGDRVGALLGRMINSDDNGTYVDEGDTPDYLHEVDPDPEPSDPEWATVTDEEFVINAAGMAKIQENLGTYVSVIGITLEMIDPYCGAILGQNLEKMVQRWSKVIAHYPKAANLFLDSKGGVIMEWIGALQVSWPFLYALYEHHLARTIRVHDGVIERKVGDSAFRGFDATTPPMPDNFAYTTS